MVISSRISGNCSERSKLPEVGSKKNRKKYAEKKIYPIRMKSCHEHFGHVQYTNDGAFSPVENNNVAGFQSRNIIPATGIRLAVTRARVEMRTLLFLRFKCSSDSSLRTSIMERIFFIRGKPHGSKVSLQLFRPLSILIFLKEQFKV